MTTVIKVSISYSVVATQLTIIIKEKYEEFTPSIPFKTRLGLTKKLPAMDQRTLLIQ